MTFNVCRSEELFLPLFKFGLLIYLRVNVNFIKPPCLSYKQDLPFHTKEAFETKRKIFSIKSSHVNVLVVFISSEET